MSDFVILLVPSMRISFRGTFDLDLLHVPYHIMRVMLGGRPGPVLSERSEFSGASIPACRNGSTGRFWFVFVAMDITK